MDPLSILVLAVFFGAVADVATGGRVRAEFVGGGKGAVDYLGSAGRKRWRDSQRLAREERMKTPMGRAVQAILDELGGLGRGLVRGWRSGARRARKAWRERLGEDPMPIVRAYREASGSVRTWLEDRANGDPNLDPNETRTEVPNADPEQPLTSPNDPNGGIRGRCAWAVTPGFLADLTGAELVCGKPTTAGPFCDKHAKKAARTPCIRCGQAVGSNRSCTECVGLRISGGDLWPYGPSPEAADPNPDPNGDPNVPTPSPDDGGPATGDRDPHVFDCGCCGRVHAPLEPGAHCPNCSLHDGPNTTPNDQPNPTRGTTVADINSAPAAIAAAEGFASRWEGLQSRADALQAELESLHNEADALHGEIATTLDGMGDFAIGGEADTSASVGEMSDSTASAREQMGNVVGSISTAKESLDAYVTNLHLEYDASIEAAAGKNADVHSVMQEA